MPDPAALNGGAARRRPLNLWESAVQRKVAFAQFFFMTGILMLSLRSLGQKYRLHDLARDTDELRAERDALRLRTAAVQDGLRREAEGDASGAVAAHLRKLFETKH